MRRQRRHALSCHAFQGRRSPSYLYRQKISFHWAAPMNMRQDAGAHAYYYHLLVLIHIA